MHPHAFFREFMKTWGAAAKSSARATGLLALLLVLVGCRTLSPQTKGTPLNSQTKGTLAVMTHDSFAVSDSVLKQFEQSTGIKVEILKSGDAGVALNKAILTKQAPLADVLYGIDNTFLTRALQENIFEPYDSPALDSISSEYRLDPQNRALPVDFGFVCINYDIAWFSSRTSAVPQTLEDLADPQFKGLLAVENPLTSSPGFAFLLATVAHFGPNGFVDYWKSLKNNRVTVADGWETAYYTDFSGSSGKGPQPMVVSYSTSPAYEMIYADPPRSTPPTASLDGPDMCFHQIEFVGILTGTPNRASAEKFVDFMLETDFQEDIPLQMGMFPVNPHAKAPEAFTTFAPIPTRPAILAPEEISAHRDEWLNLWKETMLP
jgi:thiamine transport system substrate-binding protein